MSGDHVYPLRLPEHQKGAQSQVADDGHHVEHTGPGASSLNQVAAQTHTYHTWPREAETDWWSREASRHTSVNSGTEQGRIQMP